MALGVVEDLCGARSNVDIHVSNAAGDQAGVIRSVGVDHSKGRVLAGNIAGTVSGKAYLQVSRGAGSNNGGSFSGFRGSFLSRLR